MDEEKCIKRNASEILMGKREGKRLEGAGLDVRVLL